MTNKSKAYRIFRLEKSDSGLLSVADIWELPMPNGGRGNYNRRKVKRYFRRYWPGCLIYDDNLWTGKRKVSISR